MKHIELRLTGLETAELMALKTALNQSEQTYSTSQAVATAVRHLLSQIRQREGDAFTLLRQKK